MILDDWIEEKIKVKDNLDRQNLESYQLNTLNNLITYAKQNSPFYRELYKNLDKINSLDELYKIPIISDKDIIENGNKMICVSQSEISRIVTLNTSGTMGQYKRIFFTKYSVNFQKTLEKDNSLLYINNVLFVRVAQLDRAIAF